MLATRKHKMDFSCQQNVRAAVKVSRRLLLFLPTLQDLNELISKWTHYTAVCRFITCLCTELMLLPVWADKQSLWTNHWIIRHFSSYFWVSSFGWSLSAAINIMQCVILKGYHLKWATFWTFSLKKDLKLNLNQSNISASATINSTSTWACEQHHYSPVWEHLQNTQKETVLPTWSVLCLPHSWQMCTKDLMKHFIILNKTVTKMNIKMGLIFIYLVMWSHHIQGGHPSSVINLSSVVCQRLSLLTQHSRNTFKDFDQWYPMPPAKWHKHAAKKEQFLSAGQSAHSIVIVSHPRSSASSDWTFVA